MIIVTVHRVIKCEVWLFIRNTAQLIVWDFVRDFEGVRGFGGCVNRLHGGVKDGGGSRLVRNVGKSHTTLHSVLRMFADVGNRLVHCTEFAIQKFKDQYI